MIDILDYNYRPAKWHRRTAALGVISEMQLSIIFVDEPVIKRELP